MSALLFLLLWLPPLAGRDLARDTLGDRALTLTRDSVWTLVTTIPIKFPTHHPQGMVKIGDTFYVSSVEVIRREAGEGSRRFSRWKIGTYGRAEPTLNPSHYVDYQDCKYAGRHRMLCTGVTEIRRPGETMPFGWEAST